MAKRSKYVRRFLRAAAARLADARPLVPDRTLAAVYLAGYTVECALKALVLSTHPEHEQRRVIAEEFRGTRGHSFRWLLRQYRLRGGARPPDDVSGALTAADGWTTDLRYEPTGRYDADADAFLAAAEVVRGWAERSV